MSTVEFDVYSTCRACLQQNSEMVQLFDSTECLSDTLGHKFIKCSSLQIEENDGLPSVICNVCIKDLSQAYAFYIKCNESDEKLKKYIKGENKTIDYQFLFDNNIIRKEELKEEPQLSSDDEVYSQEEQYLHEESFVNNEIKTDLKSSMEKIKQKKSKLKRSNTRQSEKCEYCNMSFKHKSNLINHIRKHTGERPFQCTSCDKGFRENGALKRHYIRFHTDVGRSFSCEVCGKLFYRQCNLNIHLRIHTGITPYKCTYCPKAFNQVGTLSAHLTTHSDEKKFSCEQCFKKFSRKTHLKRHMLVHSDEKKFVCDICGKSLKSKFSLKVHDRMHRHPKLFGCENCSASFSTKGCLKSHLLRVHSEKSGVCPVCNKSFSVLNDHMRIHSGETPFQCQVCGKSYSLIKSLRVHEMIHKNAEKFPCLNKNCPKSFPKKSMLEYHILKFHKHETPYKCSQCDRSFFRHCDLKLHHVKSHKPKDTKTISNSL